jgi:hypothetical protein
MAKITVNATIVYNATLRIGYKIKNSSNPFVYVPAYPEQADLPYEITGVPVGAYEVELTQICPNCSGGLYSDPIIVDAVAI